jgi:hypothetical protein
MINMYYFYLKYLENMYFFNYDIKLTHNFGNFNHENLYFGGLNE